MRFFLPLCLLLAGKASHASRDDTYYRDDYSNPLMSQGMYWRDAINILEDISSFESLSVRFHSCVWSTTTYSSNNNGGGGGGGNDYWYLGYTPTEQANVAFSLYGALAGSSKSVGKCGRKQYINSFYTNAGFTAFLNTALLVGHTSENGTLSGAEYMTASCNANYQTGIGCSGPSFAEYFYNYSDLANYVTCNADSADYVTDPLLDLNFYLESVDCIEIYNVHNDTLNVVPSYGNNNNNKNGGNNNNKNGNNGGVYISAPLELLVYSTACTYMDAFGRCPDPFGGLKNYAKALNAKPLEQHFWFSMAKSVTLVLFGLAFLLVGIKLLLDERESKTHDDKLQSVRKHRKRIGGQRVGFFRFFKRDKKPMIVDDVDVESSQMDHPVKERGVSSGNNGEYPVENTQVEEQVSKLDQLRKFFKHKPKPEIVTPINVQGEASSENTKRQSIIVDEELTPTLDTIEGNQNATPISLSDIQTTDDELLQKDLIAFDHPTIDLVVHAENSSGQGQEVGINWLSSLISTLIPDISTDVTHVTDITDITDEDEPTTERPVLDQLRKFFKHKPKLEIVTPVNVQGEVSSKRTKRKSIIVDEYLPPSVDTMEEKQKSTPISLSDIQTTDDELLQRDLIAFDQPTSDLVVPAENNSGEGQGQEVGTDWLSSLISTLIPDISTDVTHVTDVTDKDEPTTERSQSMDFDLPSDPVPSISESSVPFDEPIAKRRNFLNVFAAKKAVKHSVPIQVQCENQGGITSQNASTNGLDVSSRSASPLPLPSAHSSNVDEISSTTGASLIGSSQKCEMAQDDVSLHGDSPFPILSAHSYKVDEISTTSGASLKGSSLSREMAQDDVTSVIGEKLLDADNNIMVRSKKDTAAYDNSITNGDEVPVTIEDTMIKNWDQPCGTDAATIKLVDATVFNDTTRIGTGNTPIENDEANMNFDEKLSNIDAINGINGSNITEVPIEVSKSNSVSWDEGDKHLSNVTTFNGSFDAIIDERIKYNEGAIVEVANDRILESRSPTRIGRVTDGKAEQKQVQREEDVVDSTSPLRFGRLVGKIGKSKSPKDVHKTRSPLRFGRQSSTADVVATSTRSPIRLGRNKKRRGKKEKNEDDCCIDNK